EPVPDRTGGDSRALRRRRAAPARPRRPGGRRARAVVASADLRYLHRPRQPGAARLHLGPQSGGVHHGVVARRRACVLQVTDDRLPLRGRRHRAVVPPVEVHPARQGHSRHVAESRGGHGVRRRRRPHPHADLRPGRGSGRGRRRASRGDRGHPARDGRRLDVQVIPGDRARRRRQLSRRARRWTAPRARRAAGLALSHDAAVRGGGVRPPGPGAPRAAERAPRPAADVTGLGYGVRSMQQIFMWIALAGSWNLISGLTGYVSFGHVAFFGAGAYAGAILVAGAGWPWPLAALAGGAAAIVLAVVIGYPCLRLKGP